jgi:hypothetical protein
MPLVPLKPVDVLGALDTPDLKPLDEPLNALPPPILGLPPRECPLPIPIAIAFPP